jgi:hypothetical protein
MLFGKIIAVYSGNQVPRPGAGHAVRMTENKMVFPQNKGFESFVDKARCEVFKSGE